MQQVYAAQQKFYCELRSVMQHSPSPDPIENYINLKLFVNPMYIRARITEMNYLHYSTRTFSCKFLFQMKQFFLKLLFLLKTMLR